MKLPIDSSAMTLLAAKSPELVTDFETKQPEFDTGGPSTPSSWWPRAREKVFGKVREVTGLIDIKVASKPVARVRQEMPVTSTRLIVRATEGASSW